MIYTKITHSNLQNVLGYLHKGKLNNTHNTTRAQKADQ